MAGLSTFGTDTAARPPDSFRCTRATFTGFVAVSAVTGDVAVARSAAVFSTTTSGGGLGATVSVLPGRESGAGAVLPAVCDAATGAAGRFAATAGAETRCGAPVPLLNAKIA